MGIFKEFKSFAMRGNMVDLAVGVIIGAAFGKVVNSFVSDIIMPPIGYLIGGVDFSHLSLKMMGNDGTPVEIKYGAFINQIIDLLIIAGAIFMVIKLMNRLYKQAPGDLKTQDCPECLMSIPQKAKKCGHCCTELRHSTNQLD